MASFFCMLETKYAISQTSFELTGRENFSILLGNRTPVSYISGETT